MNTIDSRVVSPGAVIELDHLVVAARRLDEGTRWVEKLLAVSPEPGGVHEGFGTHNALLRLGDELYLEILAPDPAQPHPVRPRLFGLDDPETRALLEQGPRLLHWVVRARDLPRAVGDIAGALGAEPAVMGVATPMQRGELRWTLTVRADGSRPRDGLPSVIDWGAIPHPCARLRDRGARLERLDVDAPANTIAALAPLRGRPEVVFRESPRPGLTAHVRSSSGVVALR